MKKVSFLLFVFAFISYKSIGQSMVINSSVLKNELCEQVKVLDKFGPNYKVLGSIEEKDKKLDGFANRYSWNLKLSDDRSSVSGDIDVKFVRTAEDGMPVINVQSYRYESKVLYKCKDDPRILVPYSDRKKYPDCSGWEMIICN